MDITALFSTAIAQLKNLIYPSTCLICDKAGIENQDLCLSCNQAMPWIKQACCQCALPLSIDTSEGLHCGRCLTKPPYFDDSLSLFSFEQAVIGLIHQLKFHDKLAIARLFGHQLTDAVIAKMDKPDCLLPVPLHRRRLKQRGFNQSIEIARALSRRWDIPIATNVITRIRETTSQTGLDAKQRRSNIKGAFEINNICYQHVAIIDDVVTTGSTVNELARILKKRGVARVSVYSIARAPVK